MSKVRRNGSEQREKKSWDIKSCDIETKLSSKESWKILAGLILFIRRLLQPYSVLLWATFPPFLQIHTVQLGFCAYVLHKTVRNITFASRLPSFRSLWKMVLFRLPVLFFGIACWFGLWCCIRWFIEASIACNLSHTNVVIYLRDTPMCCWSLSAVAFEPWDDHTYCKNKPFAHVLNFSWSRLFFKISSVGMAGHSTQKC